MSRRAEKCMVQLSNYMYLVFFCYFLLFVVNMFQRYKQVECSKSYDLNKTNDHYLILLKYIYMYH